MKRTLAGLLAVSAVTGVANANDEIDFDQFEATPVVYYELPFGQGSQAFSQSQFGLQVRYTPDARVQSTFRHFNDQQSVAKSLPALMDVRFKPSGLSGVYYNGFNITNDHYALGVEEDIFFNVLGMVAGGALTYVVVSNSFEEDDENPQVVGSQAQANQTPAQANPGGQQAPQGGGGGGGAPCVPAPPLITCP